MIDFHIGDKFVSIKGEYAFINNATITKIEGHKIECKFPDKKREERNWCDRGAISDIIEKEKAVKLISGKIQNWKERIK